VHEWKAKAMKSTIKDVMSTHVIAVRQGASYKDMAAMLREQRVSAFPVIDDDNKVIGVVSGSDLLTKEALEGTVPVMSQSMMSQREHTRAGGVTAAELMTTPPVTIGHDDPVTQAARLMYSRRVKRLPVTSDDGTLIGIVSRSDVLSVYSRTDADIQHEILQDLIPGMSLGDPARVRVSVTDGIVTIEGTAESAVAGRDVIEAARHVEGVVAVRDRLSCPKVT
jgi:CBS-domain-containing membrane protein